MRRMAFFLPFRGCAGRCVYCDQRSISGEHGAAPTPASIAHALRNHRDPVELCFFGGSFARQSLEDISAYLDTVGAAPPGSLVTFSTHPADFAGERGSRLATLLARYPVGTVELGVPSLDAAVLARCNRTERPEAVARAAALLRGAGIRIGVQTMLGLPGQHFASAEADLRTLCGLKGAEEVWDLRIYPCLVLRDTPLADLYATGAYTPLSLDEAVRQAGTLLCAARARGFRLLRVGLTDSADLRGAVVAGPYHPAFGELARSEAFVRTLARQKPHGPWPIPAEATSLLKGHGGRGIRRLSELLDLPPQTVASRLHFSPPAPHSSLQRRS